MSYQTEYGFEIDDQIKRQTAASYNRDPQNLDLPAPIVRGEPEIPVLSIHTTGDLFVPIEMQQIYAQEIKENDRSHLLVQRAIRDVGHCSFTSEESNNRIPICLVGLKQGTDLWRGPFRRYFRSRSRLPVHQRRWWQRSTFICRDML